MPKGKFSAKATRPDVGMDDLRIRVPAQLGEELRAALLKLPREVIPNVTHAYTQALRDYLQKLRRLHNDGEPFTTRGPR